MELNTKMFSLKHRINHLLRFSAFALSTFTCGVVYAPPLDIADFFPLDVASQWNYIGTVTETTPEIPIGLTLGATVFRQNLPGGTNHGRETTLVLDLAAATTSVGGELLNVSRGVYYSLDELYFAAHRVDEIELEESHISLFDAPLFITPRLVDIGDSFSSSVDYTFSGVDLELGEAFTGQGSESVDVTIEGIEFVDTPAGNYETLKVVVVRNFNETSMVLGEIFTEDGTIIEIYWFARNIGPVKLTFDDSTTTSEGFSESFSYDVVLAGSNRNLEPIPVFLEDITPLPPPPNLEIFTDFEAIVPAGSDQFVGSFTIGESPKSATFQGGSVGGLTSFTQLYHSPENFWSITNGLTATINFETPARDVQFYAANLALEDGKIEVFDTEGNLLTDVPKLPDNINPDEIINPLFYRFNALELGAPGGIGKIELIDNEDILSTFGSSITSIDDFSFNPIETSIVDPPIIDKPPSFIKDIIEVEGWGSNDFNQQEIPQAVTTDDSSELIAISAGLDHNLALTADGTVVGWGKADEGQIDVPQDLTDVIAIAAGHNHSLAVKSDGNVVGWGNNEFGQTQPPDGLSGVTAVSAGSTHSLALLSDGTVAGWGNDADGQASAPPGNPSDIIAIDAGGFHNLALKSDGTVIAWGRNNFGQTDVPPGLTGVTEVSAGGNHSLALTEDNQIAAWGDNQFNQLEFGDIGLIAASSFKSKGQLSLTFNANAVTSIAAGLNHSLALDDEGLVEGWGDNSSGQLNIPSTVSNVSLLAAGGNHNVAIVQRGLVLSGFGDVVGENIMHPSGNIFDQVLLTGESVKLRAKVDQITRVSFLDENEDIVQVEFSGSGSFSVILDPNTFQPPAFPSKYNQEVLYVAGRPSVLIDEADTSTFFSIFTVGSLNAVNQALFPEGEVYNAEANVTLVEIINSTGMGGMQLSNATFSATTGRTGVVADGVPIAVRMTLGDIDASGDALPYLLFGEGSFTVQAPNPGLRITGGNLSQSNGNGIIVAPSGSTTPGFDTLISQNNFKSDGTPQPTQSINATFENADGTNIPVTTEEITIE